MYINRNSYIFLITTWHYLILPHSAVCLTRPNHLYTKQNYYANQKRCWIKIMIQIHKYKLNNRTAVTDHIHNYFGESCINLYKWETRWIIRVVAHSCWSSVRGVGLGSFKASIVGSGLMIHLKHTGLFCVWRFSVIFRRKSLQYRRRKSLQYRRTTNQNVRSLHRLLK